MAGPSLGRGTAVRWRELAIAVDFYTRTHVRTRAGQQELECDTQPASGVPSNALRLRPAWGDYFFATTIVLIVAVTFSTTSTTTM
jgi:hypothetical protein